MPKTIYLKKLTSDKSKTLLCGFKKHLKETDRGSSVRSYVGDVQRFSDWLVNKFGSANIQAVSPLDIVQYRQELQDKCKSPSTINRALIAIRIFFGWLVREKVIRDNPADGIKQVAVASKTQPKWLDRSQQAALVRAVRTGGHARDHAIVLTMMHAGLRVSEVCALDKSNIIISDRAGRVIVRQGKGNKYREVPLNKTIRRVLSHWLIEHSEGPLFPNRNNKPISERGVFNLVAKYAYDAKLEDVTPHTLRHTFCKNLIVMGVPIDQVALMAGHSSLEVTKRYTVPSVDDLQAAIEKTAWE